MQGDLPYSIGNFVQNSLDTYYFLWIGIGVSYILWLRLKRRFMFFVVFLFFVGHVILVSFSYPTSSTQDFYIENLYIPAVFIVSLSFSFSISMSKGVVWQKAYVLGFYFLFGFRVYQIFNTGESIYSERYAHMENLVSEYVGKNVLIVESQELIDDLLITWGVGYESWLLQSDKETPYGLVVVVPDVESYQWALKEADRAIFMFHQPKRSSLVGPRFNLSPSSYEVIEIGF